jgi:hypothetical protein
MTTEFYEPCSCGSGKKYKFCCYGKDRQLSRLEPRALLERATDFPVDKVLINEGGEDIGPAAAMISRRLPNGNFFYLLYLVDIFKGGILDIVLDSNVRAEIVEANLDLVPGEFAEATFEEARSLLLGAVGRLFS